LHVDLGDGPPVIEDEPIALQLAEMNAPAVDDAPKFAPRSIEHTHSGSTFPPTTENAIENT
jgi:hypothetical protein